MATCIVPGDITDLGLAPIAGAKVRFDLRSQLVTTAGGKVDAWLSIRSSCSV